MPNTAQKSKQPKHDERLFSRAAEAVVIGSIIIDPACIVPVSKIIGPSNFAFDENRIIYQALLDLKEEGIAIDGFIVRNRLEETKQLKKVGGVEYLQEIVNIPTAANAEYYAKIVQEKAQRRRLAGFYDDTGKVLFSDRAVGESIATIQQLAVGLDGAVDLHDMTPIFRCLADIAPEHVKWIWHEKIALGKINLILGDPNTCKTWLGLYIVARISTGGKWPNMNGDPDNFAPLGSAIILTAEDGLADTIRPRLDAMGANVSKIIVVEGVREKDEEGNLHSYSFCLRNNLTALQQIIDNVKDVKIVLLDPLSGFLGDTDSHRDADVRGVLAPLSGFAEKNGIAIVGIRHLNKNSGGKAMYRDSGSLAFIAASRLAWLVSTDPDNPESKRRLLIPIKYNVIAEPVGLAFEVIDGKVVFENEPVNTTADEALGGSMVVAPKREMGVQWLKDTLAGKTMASSEVERLAKENGISAWMLKEAKRELGVVNYPLTQPDKKMAWFMKLPE